MNEQTQITEKQESFDLQSIFSKKIDAKQELPKEESKEKPEGKKEEEPVKKPAKEDPKKEAVKSVVDANESEDEDEDEKPDARPKKEPKDDSNNELEKTQKALKETQKWGNETRKQLANYKKTVEKMMQDGILTEDEARALQDHTIVHEDEQQEVSKPVIYGQIWDKELEYMKKYSPSSKEIEESADAFTHLVNHCTQEELIDIFADLSSYEEDETELTKRMIEIGREYYDDIYGDIQDVGSIRNLKKKYSEKEQELQKRIDKLEAKYSKLKEKYEDHDQEPSGMRMRTGGLATGLPKDTTFEPSAIFGKRHKGR